MISLSTVPIPDQRFPFIFPALRRGLLHSRRPGICSILYRAFDSLFGKTLIVDKLNVPLDQSPHLSPTFCLFLPLSAVVSWSTQIHTKVQNTFDSLLVQDAFFYNNGLLCLSPRSSDSLPIGRYRILKLLRWIQSGDVILLPFFARLCLPLTSNSDFQSFGQPSFDNFCRSLVEPAIDQQTLIILPKYFRKKRLDTLAHSISSFTNSLRPVSFWKQFWNMDVPLAVRNPWYRLLHQKLPSAAVIHKMIPDLCGSSCRLCASVDVMEDPEHFLFLCPKKLTIWRLIWRQFFGVMDVELSAIRKALYNLTFPRQKLRFIQNDTIVGCTFLGIWKAHWRLTFDDVPFDSNIVHNQILLMIASMRSNALHSLV
ncbi:hypothetical protein G6F37_010016 [Rhizopus arrhizus]|nr:hypothetical protein G6F37_010016 [Rhizopus arrhizus]